jgi:hypothetical protein
MWDLTVDAAHSFFVGSGGVLVHNFNGPCGPGTGRSYPANHMRPDAPLPPKVESTLENETRQTVDQMSQDLEARTNPARQLEGHTDPLPGGGGVVGKLSQFGQIIYNFYSIFRFF